MIELHAHLSGSIRQTTLVEFLKDNDPDCDLAFLNDNSLEACFQTFAKINSLNLCEVQLRRVVKEILEDFHKDGCTYLELRSTPKDGKDYHKAQYIQIVCDEMQKFPQMESALIISIDRGKSVDAALKTFKLLKTNKFKKVVGVDFCGHPAAGKFSDFKFVLDKFRKLGYPVTLHAGELPDQKDELSEMLDWHPDRIGHLIYFTDEQLDKVIQLQIPVEICLTSNLCTTGMHITKHPINKLYGKVPIAICTDDTLCFRTSLSQEVSKAQELLQLETIDKLQKSAYLVRFQGVK